LHRSRVVNRQREHISRGAIVPVDERRRLLEQRIELAKERLVADIRRAGGLVRHATQAARHGLVRVAIVACGFLVVGFAMALIARRRSRVRAAWR
jgi:hypothetical protein